MNTYSIHYSKSNTPYLMALTTDGENRFSAYRVTMPDPARYTWFDVFEPGGTKIVSNKPAHVCERKVAEHAAKFGDTLL